MRHQKKGFKLNRTASHRKATLSALSNALIRHKRITTTWTKARALRTYIEPIINRAKEDSTHNRRQAFRHLQDKETVTELFGDIASHIGERPGGYTRIIKLGQRAGDSAEMAMIELVDYNDVRPDSSADSGKRKTRRAGRKRAAGDPDNRSATSVAVPSEVVEDDVADTPNDEEVAAEPETAEEAAPESEAAVETVAAEPEAAEEAAPEPEAAEETAAAEPEGAKGSSAKETGDADESEKGKK